MRDGCNKLAGVGQPEGGGRGWRVVLKEDVMEEARARQAGVAGETQTLKEEASANESYEKRQMLWKGMAGRGWTELVQQWSVPVVESLWTAAEVDRGPGEGDRPSAGWLALGGVDWAGEGEQGAAKGGNGHAGGSAHSQEAEGTWLVWRGGPGEMHIADKEAAGVGS